MHLFKRYAFLGLCVFYVGFASSVLSLPAKGDEAVHPDRPPHIVFILADDLGWNDVSYHGSSQIPTPNLDALAAAGVELDNYYVNPVCSPTRASLMTGRSMMHTGIQTPYGAGNVASGMNLSYVTIAEALRDNANYSTAAIGKWHLGMKTPEYLPSARGFERYFGYYCGIMDYWKHYEDSQDMGATALDLHEGGVGLGLKPGSGDRAVYGTAGEYSTFMFARKASEWIEEHAEAEPEGKPMFLYLALQAAHSSNNKFVQAPSAYIDSFEAISPANETCGQYELPGTPTCTKRAMRKTTASVVSALDDAVGDVVEALKRNGMYNNTIIIFSTDNGGPTDGTNCNMMNNFPLRSGKGETFEGGVRGVGFIHAPKIMTKTSGSISRQLFHVSDWYETLLSAAVGKERARAIARDADAAVPWKFGDGVDNWAALLSGSPSARAEILHAAQAEGSVLKSWALRSGDLKYVLHPSLTYDKPGWYPPPSCDLFPANYSVKCGPPPETVADDCSGAPCLFNITADPCEYVNLANRFPGEVARLRARLEEYATTAVLPWLNFAAHDPNSDPTKQGPTKAMVPNPIPMGPSEYQGVWMPWMTPSQALEYYPSNYSGPGY